MSKSTISTFQLFERFPNQEPARHYLEGRLWPNGVICPTCKSGERITVRKAGFYRCNACAGFTFTVRTGTIFERSHIPLHKWLVALYLFAVEPGLTIAGLSESLDVTTRTAWLALQRIRLATA